MNYEEFRNDAMRHYMSMPYETEELYKKYSVSVPLEKTEAAGTSDRRKFLEHVEKSLSINFDVVLFGDFIRNKSSNVRIERMQDIAEVLGRKQYKSSEGKLAAFSNAYSERALLIRATGEAVKINALFVNDGSDFSQVFVDADSSAISLSEFYFSTSDRRSLVSVMHEAAAESSKVEINQVHCENKNANLVNLFKGYAGNSSSLRINAAYNGAALTKAIGKVSASGIGSDVRVSEVVYGASEQRFDINTFITNASQKSNAMLESGAVLDGNSNCVFKGYAKVDKWTKGAKSRITERGILLSQTAHIDALPDMSIDYSDEVSATHSAATAPMDKDAIFYMGARGVKEEQAREMFVSAFLSRYLSGIGDPRIREIASSLVLGRIGKSTFGDVSSLTSRGIWSEAMNNGD